MKQSGVLDMHRRLDGLLGSCLAPAWLLLGSCMLRTAALAAIILAATEAPSLAQTGLGEKACWKFCCYVS